MYTETYGRKTEDRLFRGRGPAIVKEEWGWRGRGANMSNGQCML